MTPMLEDVRPGRPREKERVRNELRVDARFHARGLGAPLDRVQVIR